MPAEFPSQLIEGLPAYLAGQRWYSGSEAPAHAGVSSAKLLWAGEDSQELWQLIVDADGEIYQLVLGVRPAGQVAEFLHGHEQSVLGSADGVFAYDAVWDSEMDKALLEVVSGGSETATRVRPMSAEQSNSSIVYDDRLILKVFRHLRPGRNPDVEVTTALASAGFEHVARPLVEWRDEDGTWDLAFGQEFLAGASEGWALALTSLRNLYTGGEGEVPAESGGDFAAEAERLGRVTAEMHLALHQVFGAASRSSAEGQWRDLVAGIPARLEQASSAADQDLLGAARPLLERLEAVRDPGPAIRVHGDYHLGQVMRTDLGWYVLDFEGEPEKTVEQRIVPASPLKDVTGMLRSFHYASRHALVERALADWADMVPSARAWESHNRQAFLEGYRQYPDVGRLLPDATAAAAVMTAYEMDKALYELEYERSHRPEWVAIPLDALERLVEGGAGGE